MNTDQLTQTAATILAALVQNLPLADRTPENMEVYAKEAWAWAMAMEAARPVGTV